MKKLAIPLTVGLSLGLISSPIMAKSTIGGILFLNTYYDSKTDDVTPANDNDNFILSNANNSRLRIKWNNEDSVSMYYELALKGSNVSVRHAYGKWDFSETGQLLAGSTSTPFAPLNPNVAMVHNSGQGYGRVSPGRPSQLRYTYKFLNRNGALAFALVDPNKGKTAGPDGTLREQSLPRLDVGMAYRTFNWQIFPSVFYQQLDYSNNVDSLTSSGVALGVKTGAGPVTLAAEFGAGKNWGNTSGSYSKSTAGDNAMALYNSNGTKGDDNDNTSYWVDVGYRFTGDETKGTIHFVYGAMTSEASDGTTSIDAKSTMMGISMPIDLPYIARGLRIRPEIFVFDDEDKGTTRVDKSNTIVGVQLQFTF